MKVLRIITGVIQAFVALNAFGGGYYGLAGAKDIPLEWLQGTPFDTYFIPALFLFIVVGGTCTLASILMLRNSSHALRLSYFCAFLLFAWIVTQVSMIGYVSWMQPAILIVALVIGIFTRILQIRNR